MHSSQLGEGGASEGVSWVGILNFHMVGAGREPWTSVSGKVEVLKTFPDPGCSPAWGAQLRPQQSSSTSRHALPWALLPVGESCYPTMAHSGDHRPASLGPCQHWLRCGRRVGVWRRWEGLIS